MASQLLLTVTDESHIVQVIFTSVHYTITFEVRGQLYGLTSSLKELGSDSTHFMFPVTLPIDPARLSSILAPSYASQ